MNNKISKLFATIMVTAMVLSVIPAFSAPLPPAIWTTPAFENFNTNTTNIGDRFNITVWASTVSVSYTWQVKLLFNKNQLKVNKADYTGVSKSLFFTGHATVPVVPVIDNVNGFVVHGESLMGTDSRPAGSDSLFWAEFEIIAAPPILGNLTSNIDPNSVDSYILDPDLNTIPGVTFDHTVYTYTWALPPNPHLAVVDPVDKDQNHHWIGTTFTQDVVIKGCSAAWQLGSATTQLDYNTTLLSLTSVVFDPIWGTTSQTEPVPGTLQFDVSQPFTVPMGDVNIATITWTILTQGDNPPRFAPNNFDESTGHLHNYQLVSSGVGNPVIPTDPAVDGKVRVYCYLLAPPPYLQVSSVTMGPGPVVGQEFNVTVDLMMVHEWTNTIGIQFRLGYDPSLIEFVTAYEGSFLPSFAALQPGSLGTFFVFYDENPDGVYGPHVIVGNMIFPDGDGVWHAPMLDGNGTVAILTFKVKYQSFGEADITSDLVIVDQMAVALDDLINQNIIETPLGDPINGVYTITTNLPGRMIDEYGGAVNSGYGNLVGTYPAFPAPYGGQGPQAPMDLVEPQSQVFIHANVTYNYWPVQHKLVAFEILKPDGSLYANMFAFTDENGVASIDFRMPWPCQNPEGLFGVWTEISTVQVADERITDVLTWHYDYMVHIWKVTTDKYQYNHGETVYTTIEYGSHAQQFYPALIKEYIKDELGVVFGNVVVEVQFGGTVYCQYKNWTITVGIWIPKWAYAGIATVHVDVFDREPMYGGVPLGPEYAPPPTIAIQPY